MYGLICCQIKKLNDCQSMQIYNAFIIHQWQEIYRNVIPELSLVEDSTPVCVNYPDQICENVLSTKLCHQGHTP